MINFSKRIRAAKPHRGFGKPRRIVQTIFESGKERFDKFNGADEQIQDVATAFLQLKKVAVVLVLDGIADIGSVASKDILAEYRRDAAGTGEQVLIRDRADRS